MKTQIRNGLGLFVWMYMPAQQKLSELRRILKVLEVNLESVTASLDKYQGLANIMLQLEAINKTRRFGKNEYMHRYLHNTNKNVSSHMRIFLYHKAMEEQLTILSKSIKNRIYELQFTIYQLEQESET